jgi:hypothetical protein
VPCRTWRCAAAVGARSVARWAPGGSPSWRGP